MTPELTGNEALSGENPSSMNSSGHFNPHRERMVEPPPFPPELKEKLRQKREAQAREDRRIYEEACEALTQAAEVDAHEIQVSVERGIVTLRGWVPVRRMKRLAEDCVDPIAGVLDVQNQLIFGEQN